MPLEAVILTFVSSYEADVSLSGNYSISLWYSLAPMSQFSFRSIDGSDIAPEQWLPMWAARFPESKYTGYSALMDKHKSLSGEDFSLIGKWKDGVKTDRTWRANVAAVAFPIWLQAASELPKCPTQSEVTNFLNDWSERKYSDQYTVFRKSVSGCPEQPRYCISSVAAISPSAIPA